MFGNHPIVQKIDVEALTGVPSRSVLSVLRLDVPDGVAGGNKDFKLRYNLLKAIQEGYSGILTFGGAYSNHIAATARAAKAKGLRSIGIIRGEKVSNITLERASRDGMQLVFINRQNYSRRYDEGFLRELAEQFDHSLIIPEGGSSAAGVRGCMEILDGLHGSYDIAVTACGTGATLAGMVASMQPNTKAIGISVLNDGETIAASVSNWLRKSEKAQWEVNGDYCFGGYARSSPELNQFMEKFTRITGIPVEPVYTGKMFYGLLDLIQKGRIPEGSRIIAVHTGGMQYLMKE